MKTRDFTRNTRRYTRSISPPDRVLRAFGHRDWRPCQREVTTAVLGGRDCLGVLPTGSGKSLCFQGPALTDGGCTIVITPLISLMIDQVDGLNRRVGDGVAECLYADQHDREQVRIYRAAEHDEECRLLYVAPERVFTPAFMVLLQRLKLRRRLTRFVIDEAHCISQWGHEFRPEYGRLGKLREIHPDVPMVALTATATQQVRTDIIRSLALREPVVVVGDVDRPNLIYRVEHRMNLVEQIVEIVDDWRRRVGSKPLKGIIYAITKADVDQLAETLFRQYAISAAAYHAGYDAEHRKRVQTDWQEDRLDIVVATVAFGLGIDRPDVRFVVHAGLPSSVESYHQETGRAGRDGQPAECVLLYGEQDFNKWLHICDLEEDWQRFLASSDADAHRYLTGALNTLNAIEAYARYEEHCRHVWLADWFDQRIPDCIDACDICTGWHHRDTESTEKKITQSAEVNDG